MIEDLEKSVLKGKFALESNKEVSGELTLDGSERARKKNSLYVSGDDSLNSSAWDNWTGGTMKGVLNDSRRVSLFDCSMAESRLEIKGNDFIHHGKLSFNNAFFGEEHILHDEKAVIESRLVIDDASILFHESEGLSPIFEARTVLGTVSAWRDPVVVRSGQGSNDKIFIGLQFENAVTFKEADRRTSKILRFFELLSGRPQNILEFLIYKETAHKPPVELQAWARFVKYDRSQDKVIKGPPCNILVDAVQNPEEFLRVLTNWLRRGDLWNEARGRFFGCFRKQNGDDIDRLVAAANMFDLLPKESLPDEVELSENIRSARDKCREIFKDLPQGYERDSMLNALGRLGKNSLRKKIRHRAERVESEIGDRVWKLDKVTDEAVACRNRYVHGRDTRIDYAEEVALRNFLTRTLEFVFAASDLVESGWDMKAWSESHNHKTRWHPFSWYMFNYEFYLKRLEKLLDKKN